MTVPMYIAEVSPPHVRGRLVSVNNLFITGGQFVASCVDGLFSVDEINGWRQVLVHQVTNLLQVDVVKSKSFAYQTGSRYHTPFLAPIKCYQKNHTFLCDKCYSIFKQHHNVYAQLLKAFADYTIQSMLFQQVARSFLPSQHSYVYFNTCIFQPYTQYTSTRVYFLTHHMSVLSSLNRSGEKICIFAVSLHSHFAVSLHGFASIVRSVKLRQALCFRLSRASLVK